MLASKNEYLNEASKTIFQLSADEQIRKRCRDREEYYQDLRNYEREIEKMRKIISENNATILEKDSIIKKIPTIAPSWVESGTVAQAHA